MYPCNQGPQLLMTKQAPNTVLDRETLGKRVHEARREQGKTLSDVAAAAGISITTISRVERGQMSLTYEKLSALAKALDLELSALFAGHDASNAPALEPSLTPAGHGISYRSDTYCYTLLNVDMRNKRMNPTHMVVYARTPGEVPEFSRHAGEEFVYVLAGTLEVHFETGKVIKVRKGDCLYFDSRIGHLYVSVGKGNAEIIGAITADLPFSR